MKERETFPAMSKCCQPCQHCSQEYCCPLATITAERDALRDKNADTERLRGEIEIVLQHNQALAQALAWWQALAWQRLLEQLEHCARARDSDPSKIA